MIVGLLQQSTGMLVFATTYFIDSPSVLISVGVLARMMSGMGAAFFVTAFYAYIPILYPEKIERMIAISELSAGTGFLLGPIVGSVLFNIGGYLTPFLAFGGLTICITPFIYLYLTSFTKKRAANADPAHDPLLQKLYLEGRDVSDTDTTFNEDHTDAHTTKASLPLKTEHQAAFIELVDDHAIAKESKTNDSNRSSIQSTSTALQSP